MSKFKTLLAVLLSLTLVTVAHAASTKFTDVQVRNLTVTGTQSVTGVSSALPATSFSGAITPFQRTLAQINALTSSTTGQIVECTDCTTSTLCTSSGTVSAGAWVVSVATGAFPGTGWSGFPHCK